MVDESIRRGAAKAGSRVTNGTTLKEVTARLASSADKQGAVVA